MDILRQHFPYIMQGKTCYLDNAATAHKPQCMIDAVSHFYALEYATVHRGLYPDAENVTAAYEECREKVADFFDAESPDSIFFTKGTTESLNALAYMLTSVLHAGDEILLTQAEHHANLLPWQRLAQEKGVVLKFIPINKTTYMVDNPTAYVSPRTKIVSITASSNILGSIWAQGELEAFIVHARTQGSIIIIDAAQAAAHEKISVQKLKADALVASGHKLYGPTGVGVVYLSPALAKQLQPYQVGGSMVGNVSFNSASYAPAPTRFEAGTPSIASIIGFKASLVFISEHIDFKKTSKHETELINLAESLLSSINGIHIVTATNTDQRHVLAFGFQDIHAHDIAGMLGTENIAVRAGNHCAQPLVQELGFDSLLRISVGCYNTEKEIRTAYNAIKKHVETMRSLFERVKND